MTTTNEMQELGQEVAELFRRGMPGILDVTNNDDDFGLWDLVNRLAHALNGAKPLCFSGHVISKETGEIEVVCITADSVIHGKGHVKGRGPALTIIPRSKLSQLDVLSAPAVITGEGFGTRYFGAYRLTYASKLSFTLPVDPTRPMHGQQSLHDLFPALLEDLHG